MTLSQRPALTARRQLGVLLALALIAGCLPQAAFARQEAPEGANGVIKGTLIDANGQPLSGYRVKVADAAGKVYESPPIGPDGKYEITGLPAGTYSYLIVDPDGKTVPARIPPITLAAGATMSQPIAIVPRKGTHGKLIAWLVGGGAAALAGIAIASNNDSGDEGDDSSMTPSSPN